MRKVHDTLGIEQSVILVILSYRIVALLDAAALWLTGSSDPLSVPLFIAVIIYNLAIIANRATVTDFLKNYPFLIAIDIAIVVVLEASSGAYKNPYHLYTYSPLLIGGFLFRYKGAFLLAGIQNILIVTTDAATGFTPSRFEQLGDHVLVYVFLYFVAALCMAYIAELTAQLNIMSSIKSTTKAYWTETKRHLELRLQDSGLSKRELQVLMLAFEGLTYEQIAGELNVTHNTVKTYIRRIFEKLGVSTKQEALTLAMRLDNVGK